MTGTRIWNIDEGTADPGYGGKEVQPINGQQDVFHNDAIFTGGGAYGTVVQHSYLGQRTQWGAQTGNVHDARFEDLWMAGSPTAGIIVDAIDRTNSGRLSGIRSFDNRYGLRVDIKRGSPNSMWPDIYYPALTTSGIDTTAPAGTLDASGHVIDAVVLAHPDNPANRWRAANPYDTWRTLLP